MSMQTGAGFALDANASRVLPRVSEDFGAAAGSNSQAVKLTSSWTTAPRTKIFPSDE
jgi:hypothetical protein